MLGAGDFAESWHQHNFSRNRNRKIRSAFINYIAYVYFKTDGTRKLFRVVRKRVLGLCNYYRQTAYTFVFYFFDFIQRGFRKFRAVSAVYFFDNVFDFSLNIIVQVVGVTKFALLFTFFDNRFGKLFSAVSAV